ncbi:unnamed protein product [Schistosoma margrebowiei]|uniref:Uncharacterized protein n=1 Tax=Schistosoma margrebowiei TaxID=48269 RepID=A0A183N166_9TREM|nr:unnamed protein product [Schistosoma margrebowiei]
MSGSVRKQSIGNPTQPRFRVTCITHQEEVPVILRELMPPDGFNLKLRSFEPYPELLNGNVSDYEAG